MSLVACFSILMASVSMAKSNAKVAAVLELLLKLHVLLGYYYFCSVLLIKLPISCTFFQKH